MPKATPSVMVVIPARYGSSRFPGKPLVMLGRKPMIQHVYEQAEACCAVTEVLVATDDERIKQAVEGFGGRAVMVAGDYRTGTDRVAGVARMFGGDYFVNLQGDEIPLQPDLLADLIDPFIKSGTGMGTLKRTIDSTEDIHNPSVVKVVTDHFGNAIYFSRAPIPVVRDDASRRAVEGLHYIHLGLYIYRRDTPPDGWRMRKSSSSCARWSMASQSESGKPHRPPCGWIRRKMSSRWQNSSNSVTSSSGSWAR